MPNYVTSLSHSDGKGIPIQRTRWWAEDADAIDAAKRWLRLHRNVTRTLPRSFDTWTVARSDLRVGARIIATGGATDGKRSTGKRTAPDSGATT